MAQRIEGARDLGQLFPGRGDAGGEGLEVVLGPGVREAQLGMRIEEGPQGPEVLPRGTAPVVAYSP